MVTWSPGQCGYWARVCECDYGHAFAKELKCGREWCPTCGQDWSDVHKQRFARWLPKAQTYQVMGLLVITIPPSIRFRFRSKSELRRFRRGVVRALKRMGYNRGLTRFHWFGDRHPGVFHPHLNILIERGRIPPRELKRLKLMAERHVGMPCVVHYSYTRSPKKMVHWLKYITRATFTDYTWDEDMADELYRFNNCHSWGKWDGLTPRWVLPKSMAKLDGLRRLEMGLCPICGCNLHWYGGLDKTSDLSRLGFKPYVAGWWFKDIPRSPPP